MEICERDSRPQGVKQRRNYCEHCESYLTKSTFYRHRSKYHNTATGKWAKLCDITVSSSSTSSDEDSSCASHDEDSSSSHDVDEVTFDDNSVHASSSYMESEQYASDFCESSLPRLSESSPSDSGEFRAPIQSKYIMKYSVYLS